MTEVCFPGAGPKYLEQYNLLIFLVFKFSIFSEVFKDDIFERKLFQNDFLFKLD